jgi:hypothetical protein
MGRVEEELLYIDTMARTVSGPSQATVHLAKKTAQELYYECLDEGEAWQFSIPKLLYKIDMQARFAAARATVLQCTHNCDKLPESSQRALRELPESSHLQALVKYVS